MGLRAGLDWCGKSRHHREFDPRTVQPLAIRYTDFAIPAPLVHIRTICKTYQLEAQEIFEYVGPHKTFSVMEARNQIKTLCAICEIVSKVGPHVRDDFGIGSDNARNSAPKMRGMSDISERKTG